MENKASTSDEIIEQAGDFDGFLRETELSGPIEAACERMRRFFVERESAGTFELADYNAGKQILLELSDCGETLSRMVRILEGSGAVSQPAGIGPA